jgi:hypothetical protein
MNLHSVGISFAFFHKKNFSRFLKEIRATREFCKLFWALIGPFLKKIKGSTILIWSLAM